MFVVGWIPTENCSILHYRVKIGQLNDLVVSGLLLCNIDVIAQHAAVSFGIICSISVFCFTCFSICKPRGCVCDIWCCHSGVHKDSWLLVLMHCQLLNNYWCLWGACCLHHQGLSSPWIVEVWLSKEFLFIASCAHIFYHIVYLIHIVVSYSL